MQLETLLLALLPLFTDVGSGSHAPKPSDTLFRSTDPRIRYTGRVDYSVPGEPRFWASGASIELNFKGNLCVVYLKDQNLYGQVHQWIEVVLDRGPAERSHLTGRVDTLRIAGKGASAFHHLFIYKDTESGNGYLSLKGVRCAGLAPLPPAPRFRMECIGNSITCGFGDDPGQVPCGKGEWYDEHNAYLSYGMLTARALGAQVHLSSVSGIGLIHSCCGMSILMPQVYEKADMRDDSIPWDVRSYQPNLVTVCLGQNDGIQDSVAFCGAYVDFLKRLRNDYPKAYIICLGSPMADAWLSAVMHRYLPGVVRAFGDNRVSCFFFSRQFHDGCASHPDLEEHAQMSIELTAYIRSAIPPFRRSAP